MDYIALMLGIFDFVLIILLAYTFYEYVKTQDKYNDMFVEHINNIYDIMKFNGLKREKTKEEK